MSKDSARMLKSEKEQHAKDKQRAAAVLGGSSSPDRQAGTLLAIVQRGQLTEESTWQQLAEYMARQYDLTVEPLHYAMKQLSECAKMQLLIRSLRRKEGGSTEAERLAKFQELMAEVYGTNEVAEEDGA